MGGGFVHTSWTPPRTRLIAIHIASNIVDQRMRNLFPFPVPLFTHHSVNSGQNSGYSLFSRRQHIAITLIRPMQVTPGENHSISSLPGITILDLRSSGIRLRPRKSIQSKTSQHFKTTLPSRVVFVLAPHTITKHHITISTSHQPSSR